jgi:hypothetical protein
MLARSPWFAVNTTKEDLHVDSFVLPPRSAACSPGTGVAWRSRTRGVVRIDGRLEDADAGGTGFDYILDLATPDGTRELVRGSVPNNAEHRLESVSIEVNPGTSSCFQIHSKEPHYDTTVVDLTIERRDGSARWNLAADVVDTLLEGNPHRDSLGNLAVGAFST